MSHSIEVSKPNLGYFPFGEQKARPESYRRLVIADVVTRIFWGGLLGSLFGASLASAFFILDEVVTLSLGPIPFLGVGIALGVVAAVGGRFIQS